MTAGKRPVCAERATGGDGLLEAKCKAAWLDLGAEMVTRRVALPEPRNPSDSIGQASVRARSNRPVKGRGSGSARAEIAGLRGAPVGRRPRT